MSPKVFHGLRSTDLHHKCDGRHVPFQQISPKALDGRETASYARYIRLSLGSATELEYHLLLARDLGLLEPSTFHRLDDQVHSVQAMLFTLMRSLHGQPHLHP